MRQSKTACLISLALTSLALCQEARAQAPYARPGATNNPYAQPTYSPFLNLFRPGATTAQNYFGLVRPQQQFQGNVQQLQQQNNSLQQNISRMEDFQGTVVTGNRGQFLNYSRFFLNNSLQQAAGSAIRPGQAGAGTRAAGGSSLTQSLAKPAGRR